MQGTKCKVTKIFISYVIFSEREHNMYSAIDLNGKGKSKAKLFSIKITFVLMTCTLGKKDCFQHIHMQMLLCFSFTSVLFIIDPPQLEQKLQILACTHLNWSKAFSYNMSIFLDKLVFPAELGSETWISFQHYGTAKIKHLFCEHCWPILAQSNQHLNS